jgi:hypothetical protein
MSYILTVSGGIILETDQRMDRRAVFGRARNLKEVTVKETSNESITNRLRFLTWLQVLVGTASFLEKFSMKQLNP